MTTYSLYHHFSIAERRRLVRVSVSDGRTGEYHATVPAPGGRVERENRELALDAIEDMIAAGLPPGEAVVDLTVEREALRA